MSHDVKYIGMDVHKEAIVIAVLNGSGKLVMESNRFMYPQCAYVRFQCFSVRAISLNCLDDHCSRASEV
jgi:hypothetical protein